MGYLLVKFKSQPFVIHQVDDGTNKTQAGSKKIDNTHTDLVHHEALDTGNCKKPQQTTDQNVIGFSSF